MTHQGVILFQDNMDFLYSIFIIIHAMEIMKKFKIEALRSNHIMSVTM